MLAVCHLCQHEFNPNQTGVSHEITGWVVDRASQGLSANAVHEKRFTGQLRCPQCTQERRLGVVHGQQSIL